MYKSIEDIPVTFGPAQLIEILGISRNKAYELVGRPDFPKYRIGRKIIISKKHFLVWMDTQFGDTNGGVLKLQVVEKTPVQVVKYK